MKKNSQPMSDQLQKEAFATISNEKMFIALCYFILHNIISNCNILI